MSTTIQDDYYAALKTCNELRRQVDVLYDILADPTITDRERIEQLKAARR